MSAYFIVLLAVLAVLSAWGYSPVIYDYNRVHFREVKSWSDFASDYLDEHDRTVKNIFLGVSTEECKDKLTAPALIGVQRHAAKDITETILLDSSEYPYELKDCAEVFFYRVGDSIDSPRGSNTDFEHGVLNEFVKDMTRVDDILFRNGFDHPIDIYWHEETKTPLYQGRVDAGGSFRMSSFLGHVFSANKIDATIESESTHNNSYNAAHPEYAEPGNLGILDYMVVDGREYEFSRVNRIETCDIDESFVPLVAPSESAVTCENIFLRFLEFAHGIWHDKRIGLNFVQPKVVRAVTQSGFELRPLPAATFLWLSDWYAQEQRRRLEEEVESTAGPCMNQLVAPSTMTHLTGELKQRLSRDLRPILESWFNGPLELTSIYGIRKYVNGSVLRMHVDTANTHVVSAIINVDQDVDVDWPLVILDHEDK